MTNATEFLCKLLDDIAIENKYDNYDVEIEPMSSGGANYSSILYVAKISVPQQGPLELFAKISNIAQDIREESDIADIFQQEHYFYTEIVNIFQKLEDKHNVAAEHKLVLSKYYGGITEETKETIVIDNLIVKGYKLYDRMESFTWEYAAKAVEVLAKFHALSIAYSEENPKEFKKIRNINFKGVFEDAQKHIFMTTMIDTAYEVIRDENKQKVKNYFNKDEKYEEWMNCYKPVSRAVLAHGDYRVSNLMYKRHKDKLEIIPLDFQLVHIGSPVYDLMYFIYLGSDARFRKVYYAKLIEHYYTELKSALQRLHVNIDDVYPRKDFETDLNAFQMTGLLLGVTVLSVITVNEDDTPEYRTDMELKASDSCKQRVNEIIDEYIERGLLK